MRLSQLNSVVRPQPVCRSCARALNENGVKKISHHFFFLSVVSSTAEIVQKRSYVCDTVFLLPTYLQSKLYSVCVIEMIELVMNFTTFGGS